MITKFVNMIESNSGELARRWARGVLESEFTRTYHVVPEERLVRMARNVYENLGKWLDRATTRIEIGKIYAHLGRERYKEGFPLCELLYSLNYEKKLLTDYITSQGVMPDAMNLYSAMDFMEALYHFFDIAVYYVVRGFQEEIFKKTSKLKGADKKEIDAIFPPGSFYYEREHDTQSFENMLEGFNLFKVK